MRKEGETEEETRANMKQPPRVAVPLAAVERVGEGTKGEVSGREAAGNTGGKEYDVRYQLFVSR